MTRIPETLLTLADQQRGLLARRQLRAAGVGDAFVRARLVSQWRAVLPGVVLLGRGQLDDESRALAAHLMAGPESIVTGHAGARLLGLVGNDPATLVSVLVPGNLAARRAGFVRVVRTHRLPAARKQLGSLPVALAARCVGDACRTELDPRRARALVIEGVQRGLTTVTQLHDELFAGPRQGSATFRSAIRAAATGAWSIAEHDLLALVARSSALPRPWLNPRLTTGAGARLPTPDLWFDDVALAVQVHSHQHHADGDRWTATIQADSALAEAGVLRVALTPREIRRTPDDTLARLERAYRSMRARPRPDVRATERRIG